MKTYTCELWSINRWLRYTGWRLCVVVDTDPDGDHTPTRIGLAWFGWSK